MDEWRGWMAWMEAGATRSAMTEPLLAPTGIDLDPCPARLGARHVPLTKPRHLGFPARHLSSGSIHPVLFCSVPFKFHLPSPPTNSFLRSSNLHSAGAACPHPLHRSQPQRSKLYRAAAGCTETDTRKTGSRNWFSDWRDGTPTAPKMPNHAKKCVRRGGGAGLVLGVEAPSADSRGEVTNSIGATV